MGTTQLPPGPTGIDDAFGPVIASMRDDLKALVDVPVWSLDDARLGVRLTEILALKAQVEELASRVAGEIDDRDLARPAGASSTRALLMANQRMSATEAARLIKTASELTDRTETTRRAFAVGDVSAEQAQIVAEAINRLSDSIDPVRVEAAQGDLLDHATRLNLTQLRHVANHLVELVDPDAADQVLETRLATEEKNAWAAASFAGRAGADGIASGRFRLPNAHLAMFKKALEAYASPRRSHLLADQDGESDPAQLPYATRMGQALADLIEHLPVDALPQHGVGTAAIVVTVDAEKLAAGAGEAWLDTGGALSISETRRLACNAGLLAAVLDGPSKVLDLGTSQRLFDRYQRLALAVRDQGCIFPGCERPPAWCEAHHRVPWSAGGPTDIDNGCLLCGFHHRLIHHSDWDLVMAVDGVIEVIPPARIDPARRPIRHQRFKPRIQ
jgi:hypothetical protein